MSFLWKLVKYFSGSSDPKSPAGGDFQLERDRSLSQVASPRPWQNLRNELHLAALEEGGKVRLTLRQTRRLIRKTSSLWRTMSEETKRKYNDLAKNSAKTRVPGLTVQKLVQQKLAQTAASAGNITLEEPMMDGISDYPRAIQRRRPPTPYPSTTSIVDEDLEQPVNRKRSDEFDGDSDDSTTSLHPPERKRPRVE
ncbi:uncharacterized protein LOC6603061 [Drosophila persimilis]|uniref:uncharacterized protein LOC6603061 n=1 Tax=Drosophila persimilis TaxID=7234 RepID=UPI000F0809D1|nr:uncharacterized protein LOC6603061 [Drosophila persimilis]